MKRRKVPARLLFSFSMLADKNKLYQEVFHAFKSAYPEKSAAPCKHVPEMLHILVTFAALIAGGLVSV